MLSATTRATSTIARPLRWRRSASTTAASASVPAAAVAGAAAALIRRRTAASTASAAAAAAARRHLSSSSSAANSATASTAAHAQNSSSSANPEGLSTLGTLFFGGLCAATFGLGCWQSVRYFEKVDQMKMREDELRAAPLDMTRFTTAVGSNSNDDDNSNSDGNSDGKQASSSSSSASFRRLVTRGTFDHTREVLVGPRGPPPGALSSSGPSSGRSSGGMSSSPQGYYVVTPLRIAGGGGDGSNNSNTILVNRGWVPMSYVKQQNASAGTWSRPTGVVTVVGVETLTERPKFLSPVHDQRTPNMLLWMDREALEERTGTGAGTGKGKGAGGGGGQHRHPLLLTETAETADTEDGSADAPPPPPTAPPPTPTFPVRPTAETVGEFKVTPTTHAGYAVTWFGLSGAGMAMTRKLLTRGR